MSSDMDNDVCLVRMEDVQPQETTSEHLDDEYDDTVLDNDKDGVEYQWCLVEDDGSNIGSMVSIHSEEVVECDENSAELIVPEVLEPVKDEDEVVEVKEDTQSTQPNISGSWPTLEILPGGVINLADKNEPVLLPSMEQAAADTGKMMYACAKCSESFKYLFCLVKHVKLHENEAKKLKQNSVRTIEPQVQNNYVCLHSAKRKKVSKIKTSKPRKLKKS